MSIEVLKGDLLEKIDEFNVIVHGCNCFCTMGAGIALQIKKKFPQAYMADLDTVRGDRSKLGTYTKAMHNQTVIINAYTQYDTVGEVNVDYDAIREVFTKLNKHYSGSLVGIPKIGAGLAGGDWDKIYNIISEVTPDLYIKVIEYESNSGTTTSI